MTIHADVGVNAHHPTHPRHPLFFGHFFLSVFFRFGVETMYTDYDNLDYFSPNGTIVPDADIDPIYETMSDLINKIRNKADNDLSLGACMEEASETSPNPLHFP